MDGMIEEGCRVMKLLGIVVGIAVEGIYVEE